MSVVHPPADSPAITWVNKRDSLRDRLGELWGIKVGERLLLHCESEESFPAASLKFYINDEIVSTAVVVSNNYLSFSTLGQ